MENLQVLSGSLRRKGESGEIEVFRVPLKFNKRLGLWHRPDTSDLKMLKDGSGDYKTVNCADKVVMDCGTNVGGFLLKACRENAKVVYGFEPEDFNFEVLSHNVEILKNKFDTTIVVEKKALVPDDSKTIQFNVNGTKNSACAGSIMNLIRSTSVEVEATNFWKKLDEIKPELIKMDIEGAEYLFFDRDFPEYVKEVVMELHGWKKDQYKQMHDYINYIKNHKDYEVVSLEFVTVFGKEPLALLHYKRK